MSTNTIDTLIALSQHRWLPILLAEIAKGGGARFVELIHRLGISRESLSRTLDSGIEHGWIMRNPGHGHPLRPEYILTEAGQSAALRAANIIAAEAQSGLSSLEMTRWSRPIVHVIDLGERRYSAIANRLSGSNPRALSQSLKALVSVRLVNRRLVDDYPPASEYSLTGSGHRIARALAG